jgi:dsRNA-specific ribonuclease
MGILYNGLINRRKIKYTRRVLANKSHLKALIKKMILINAFKIGVNLWMLEMLKDKIYNILKDVVDNHDLEKILSEDSMNEYWTPAFIHKSAECEKDNSKFAVFGIDVIRLAFSQYLRTQKGPSDANVITLTMNKHITSKSLHFISEKIGLLEYVQYDESYRNENEDLIMKAFFGCLNNIIDDKIQQHFGYVCCYKLVEILFKDIELEVERDPKSQLKEIYEKMNWTQPKYITNNNNITKIIANKGKLVEVGYGIARKESELNAIKNALLERRGISLKTVELYRINEIQAFEVKYKKQYQRVKDAINKYDKDIIQFEIVELEKYTFGIKVVYQDNCQKLIYKLTGSDSMKTKCKMMKTFADKYI